MFRIIYIPGIHNNFPIIYVTSDDSQVRVNTTGHPRDTSIFVMDINVFDLPLNR